MTTTETSTPHPTEVSLLPQHRPHPYLTTTRDLASTKIILIVTPTVLIHTCLRSPASTQLSCLKPLRCCLGECNNQQSPYWTHTGTLPTTLGYSCPLP
ncbi:hypothetical protein XF_0586 [Xylella fastidiosa 9a5c]|uniref:Uncharacterized protein n=1 Tax=Xylella fastidiosa (strain 9a5c) TaxID=160492 RepID=Q9PFS1_XYLFA|nr:hypothetical protein XF_0586 [Xylella fastidiosa 9a5c]